MHHFFGNINADHRSMLSADLYPCVQRSVTGASSNIQDLLTTCKTRKIDQGLCTLREELQGRLIIACRRQTIRFGNRGFVGIKVHILILLVGHHHSGASRMSCARLLAALCVLTSGMLPALGCTEAACYNAPRSMQEHSVTQGVLS